MAHIRVRRARKDYPHRNILAIYDNGGQTFDRYTAVYVPFIDRYGEQRCHYRYMSENPSHPQGVGMSGECEFYDRPRSGWGTKPKRYDKVIAFEALPAAVQRCILQDCGA